MSRKCSLNSIFEFDDEFSIQYIKPTGDCLYDCLVEGFRSSGHEITLMEGVVPEPGDTDIQALRRTVSGAVSDEDFANFQLFFEAGLPDFVFMRRCKTVQDIKDRLLVTGKGAGAGQCLWANEFEIGVLCRILKLTCLIVDMQARDLNSRFISVSPCDVKSTWFIILQRTRREHYNLIKYRDNGVVRIEDLSQEIKDKWKIKD